MSTDEAGSKYDRKFGHVNTLFKIVEIFCAKCTVETSIDNKITNLL